MPRITNIDFTTHQSEPFQSNDYDYDFYTLLSMPPELFPHVASQLPLYATPATLLALALVNHETYEITHDILYSRLILRNEKDAVSMFRRILANPELGRAVTELHVMSELSEASRNGETTFDTVTGLTEVVKAGYLPRLHTLDLNLVDETWLTDDDGKDIIGFGHLPSDFWEDLESKCPRLQAVVLSGIIGEDCQLNDPWIDESGLYELRGLQKLLHIGVTFRDGPHAQDDGPERFMQNIHKLSPSLHTLILGPHWGNESASPIMLLSFPTLKSLTLAEFVVEDTSEAMNFWRRHPLIEKLKLPDTDRYSHWFSKLIEGEHFLPNLKYLEVNSYDVLALIPILPRLIGLSILHSMNAQIPYLLRFLIPAGLPNLKSLEIHHTPTRGIHDGSRCYETKDGTFHTETNAEKSYRLINNDYILSIVRGAPNIEELCLHGARSHPAAMLKLAPEFAKFRNLKRLYYRGLYEDKLAMTQENRDIFYTCGRAIAKWCKSLERLTDVGSDLPYWALKIRRKHTSKVDAVLTEGYGMTIGSDDEAFPRNPEQRFSY